MFYPLNTARASLAQQLFQIFPGFVQHHLAAGLGGICELSHYYHFVSQPSLGGVTWGNICGVSQSQPELAVPPALPEPCLTSLVLPSPASKEGIPRDGILKPGFKASGSPVWGGSG